MSQQCFLRFWYHTKVIGAFGWVQISEFL